MSANKIMLATILFTLLLGAPAFPQIHVAVLEFSNESDDFYLDQWQRGIPDLLKAELGKHEALLLLERKNLKLVLEEKALSQTGLTDSSHVVIGRLLNAEYIISGSIHHLHNAYIIESSVVKVSNGQSLTENVQCADRKHLREMVTILGNNIAWRLTGEGKYLHKKKIGHNPVRYFLIGGAGLAVGAGLAWGGHQKKYDEYHDNRELEKFKDLYDQSNNLKKLAVGLGAATATVFVASIYVWLKNRSPKEIVAGGIAQKKWTPQIRFTQNKEVLFGARIHF